MFVHRLASHARLTSPINHSNSRPARRRALALTLAASMAAPTAFLVRQPAHAAELAPPILAAEMEKLPADQALARGAQELKDGQYEEAVSTLQAIDPKELGSDDIRNELNNLLGEAQKGATERQNARAAFERGEAAMAAGNYAEAASLYGEASQDRYADEGTRDKATQQLAVAEAEQAKVAAASKDAAKALKAEARRYYDAGRKQFRSGDWIAARESFNKAIEAGFKPGLFEDSPQKMLARMDKKEAADRAKTEAEIANQNQPAPEPVAETPAEPAPAEQPMAETPAEPAPEQPAAEKPAEPAPEPAAEKPAEPAPEQPAAETPAEPAPAEQPVAEQPAPEQPVPTELTEKERKAIAHAAYVEGRRLYKVGDWNAAREQFNKAVEFNYKPGLFEDSPQTILARMDKKEAADRAKNEAEIAKREAEVRAAEDQARMDAEAAAVAAAAAAAEQARAKEEMAPEQPAPEVSAEKPAEPVAEKPAEPAAEKPAEPAAETPAEPMAEKPAETPAETVAEAPAEAPAPTDDLAAREKLDQVANEAAAAEAQALVEQANEARARNDYAGALDLYTNALQKDENNAAARQGVADMLLRLGRGPGASPLMEQHAKELEARRQASRWAIETSLKSSGDSIASGDFNGAQLSLEDARNRLETSRTIFSNEETASLSQMISNRQVELDNARAAYDEQKRIQQANQTSTDIKRTEQAREEELQRTVAGLIARTRSLVNDGKYEEALGVLDQILQLDGNNDYALSVRPLVEDRALFFEQRRFREDFDRQFTRTFNQAEEKKIPYDDILRYPANWPDISEIREESVRAERNISEEDEALIAQLDKRLPELRFEAVGFADVIDFLRDVSGANLFVNWRALEAAGVDRNAPVTARLRDVKFSKALDIILADVGGGTVALGYTTGEGVITISTGEDLSKNVVTRVYDIRDLIVNIPDFGDAPDFNLESSTSSGGGSGGGGGEGLFGGDSGGGEGDQEEELSRTELVDQIIQLISETVAPETWREAGGSIGAIRELSGQLIVTQTPENHTKLQGLLEQLRETRAIQVTVEARFLTVQRNFLEDIGFDADFVFNVNNAWSDNFSEITVDQDTLGFTSNPDSGAPGSLGVANNTGMVVSGSFLDDFQVNFLLQATQLNQNSTLVTAPRVTLFNGQRAYVVVATQRAYVSDLTPVVAEGVGLFDPTIDVVESGVLLDVQATVSSDRKYVTLTLRPQLATLLELVRFPISAVINNDTANGGTGNDTLPGTQNDIAIAKGFLQQPILQITEVRTTVSVPDGGTLLLGGQTIAGEIEKEAGVPVLSKVPFLKRLFTNRSTAKDEQILLILVKPTIIIQREAEQKQFPLLSSKVAGQ